MEKASNVLKLTLCAHYYSLIKENGEDSPIFVEDCGDELSAIIKACEDQRIIPTIFSLKVKMLEQYAHYINYVLCEVFGAKFDETESDEADRVYNFNSQRKMFQALSRIADVIF